MGKRLIGVVLATIFLAWSVPATAQGRVCGDREQLIGLAEKQYGEKLILRGLTKRQTVVEIFSNEDGSSWTALITHPNGLTCVADAGEGLEVFNPAYGDPS